MAENITRESILSKDLICSNQKESQLEFQVLLPEITQGEAQVLFTDGTAKIRALKAQADKLTIDGELETVTVYSGTDIKAACAKASKNFSIDMEMPGLLPGHEVSASASLEKISCITDVSQAKLNTVISVKATACELSQVQVITDINDIPLETKRTSVSARIKVGEGSSKALVDSVAELPFGLTSKKILFDRSTAAPVSVSVIDGGVTISGIVTIDAYHLTPLLDKPIAKTHHVLPFDTAIDIDSARQGQSAKVTLSLSDTKLTLQTDDDGASSFLFEGKLTSHAVIEDQTSISVIEDAYSTGISTVDLKMREINIKADSFLRTAQDQLRLNAILPKERTPIGALLACFARPVYYDIDKTGNASITGSMDVSIVYLPEGSTKIESFTQELPFEAVFDIRCPDCCMDELTVKDIDAVLIATDQVEARMTLALKCEGDMTQSVLVPTDAVRRENDLPEKSMISVYFVQNGDTLWSIAKNCLTTIDNLKRFNPDCTHISPGDKLILLKKGRGALTN
ncbi:MAG: DUF3794 domain-containing protein [Clostridia bacterium]|nr:DUF3794 domain-containing protein [Clostridia bacterium]